MGLLDGKVAIITGAGGGIGKAHALAFAKEGAKVVVNDVGGARDGDGSNQSMADSVVELIKEQGGTAIANYDSVAESAAAENIIQTAVKEFGRLDILVNNAGILRDKTLLKMDDSMWDPVISVHLNGTFYCGRAAARYMKENGIPGRIINTSSIAGLKGNFGQSNYGAAKAGIAGLTRIWSQELGRNSITVNAIAPMAKTRMTDEIEQVGKELTPETISPIVVFLASDLAKEVTGRIFGVHGNHLFEYHMHMSEGVHKDSLWTPQEIAEKLESISQEASAATTSADDSSLGTRIRKAFQMMEHAFTPKKAKNWTAILHFLIDGADDHSILIAEEKVEIRTGIHGEPTCKIKVAATTLADMIEGKISGQRAFMTGKMKANNMKDMMKFGKVFDFKRARSHAKSQQGQKSPAQNAGGGLDQLLGNIANIFLPEKAGNWKGKVGIQVEGTPGWTITIEEKICKVVNSLESKVMCLITADSSALESLITGKLSFAKASESGKVKANNVMGFLKFKQIFDWGSSAIEQTKEEPQESTGLNRELVGKKYRAGSLFTYPEKICAYSEATNDPNAHFNKQASTLLAPPVFPVTLVSGLFQEIFSDDLGGDLVRMMHGEQRIRYHKWIKSWDLLAPRGVVSSIEDKDTGQLLHIDQFLYREGELAVEMRTSLFFRNDKSGGSKEKSEQPASGEKVFSRQITVTETHPKNYANASGDHNPIHLDENVAKSAGLKGVILHGLCTMAFSGQAVLEEYLEGNPERLREISVRFRKPVYPGETLTTEGYLVEEGVLSFATVNQQGEAVITNGVARFV